MTKKVGRNDPCPCGSKKKYKQCCWKKHQGSGSKFSAKKLSATGGVIGDVFSNISTSMESLKDRVKKGNPKK